MTNVAQTEMGSDYINLDEQPSMSTKEENLYREQNLEFKKSNTLKGFFNPPKGSFGHSPQNERVNDSREQY